MYYLATYLVYIAVLARAIGWNQETAPIPATIWILLGIFGLVLISQQPLTRRFTFYPRIYILVQTGLVIAMMYTAPSIDFITMLFLTLFFQAVQFFPNWIGFSWIGICILSIAGMLFIGLEWQAGLTSVVTAAVLGFLMGSFAYLIAHTEMKQQENQRLFGGLQEAYRQLKDASAQSEALAAADERYRLVRELHDSLTQILFSMNLAVQSAQFSIVESSSQADEHLARLQALARSAASEVQALTGQVSQQLPVDGELPIALQKLAAERLEQDGLRVNLEVSGQRALPEAVHANLYRITQEALNNISRHAGINRALVRLCLDSPSASLEVVDEGCGFEMVESAKAGGFGLAGMARRAADIGWTLEIRSQPGRGTHIRLEEKAQ